MTTLNASNCGVKIRGQNKIFDRLATEYNWVITTKRNQTSLQNIQHFPIWMCNYSCLRLERLISLSLYVLVWPYCQYRYVQLTMKPIHVFTALLLGSDQSRCFVPTQMCSQIVQCNIRLALCVKPHVLHWQYNLKCNYVDDKITKTLQTIITSNCCPVIALL